MYHTIQFFVDFVADVEISPKEPLQRVLIHNGSRWNVQLKPYVTETINGPVEVADLFFEDGTCTRMVPFAWLAFVD